jgi:hypothetical protein
MARFGDFVSQGANDQHSPNSGSGAVLKRIPLSRPLVTHQGDVSFLTLREPTLSDYIALGDIDTPVATEFVDGVATVLRTHTYMDALIGWTVSLTGLDRIVLGRLSAVDSGALFAAVRSAVEPFTKSGVAGNSQSAPTNSSSSSGLTPSLSPALR